MSKVIQYTGTATIRKVSAESFRSVGVTDQEDVVIDTRKRHLRSQARVSDMAAEYLVANDTFLLVEDDDISAFFRELDGIEQGDGEEVED